MKGFILFLSCFMVLTNMYTQDFEGAHEINQRLGRGINMGNAFEAPTETAWSNPWKPEYFKIMSELGFSHVRIPIRWSTAERTMVDHPYTVNPVFMQRIQQVVDTALKYQLHPIINMHHHQDLLDNVEEQKERFLAQWQQIAAHFRDYPDSLLFEIFNEPHGTIDPPKWNVLFHEALDIIRETNPKRVVLIGTAPWGGLEGVSNLVWPDDEYLILTVHYYNPFQFTHQGAEWVGGNPDAWLGTQWKDTEAERDAVKNDFAFTKSFAEQHQIPVHVGEFGAYYKADTDSRVRWTTFLARWFEQQGFSWAYWEFSAGFGIYNPNTQQINQSLTDALLHNSMPDPTGVEVFPVFETDFSSGSTGWYLGKSETGNASMKVEEGQLHVNITNAGTEPWHVQLSRGNLKIEKDQMYRVSITAKAEQARNITAYIGRNSSPWNSYSGFSGLSLSPDESISSFTFTMKENTDNSARLAFDLGASNINISISHVAVDKIVIQTSATEPGLYPAQPRVFPNPFADRLTIDNLSHNEYLAMYDTTGRLIINQLVNDKSLSLNTEALSSGLYILRIAGSKDQQSFKLIKN